MNSVSEKFWESKTLAEMSDQEWESLCDGCGRCCLQKLECADSGKVFYTELICQLFDQDRCQCSDYTNRTDRVSNCLNLRDIKTHEWAYMPSTCAYRLLVEGQGLMPWHPLIVGDDSQILATGLSVKRKVLSETEVAEEDFEEHIITWVEY